MASIKAKALSKARKIVGKVLVSQPFCGSVDKPWRQTVLRDIAVSLHQTRRQGILEITPQRKFRDVCLSALMGQSSVFLRLFLIQFPPLRMSYFLSYQ
jgi:hypothetical protein